MRGEKVISRTESCLAPRKGLKVANRYARDFKSQLVELVGGSIASRQAGRSERDLIFEIWRGSPGRSARIHRGGRSSSERLHAYNPPVRWTARRYCIFFERSP